MLVVIEGTDGAGKATQAKLLADRMQPSKLFSFHRYDTPLGALIKRHLTGRVALREEHSIDSSDHRIDGDTVYRVASEDPLVFQCLATIDKYDAANEIRAYLAEGAHVICDRYTQSALAYGLADGMDQTWLRRIQSSLPEPDLNIFIDLSEEEALRRRPQLRDRYEKDREKQRKVHGIYKALWAAGGPGQWAVINGQQPVEAVHDAIWTEVVDVYRQLQVHTCGALCPCCSKPCSGQHRNQLHGVAPDDHWGGAKV